MIYTTSLPVSQRIKELVGEPKEGHERQRQFFHYDDEDNIVFKYSLCQLPEVLKKVGEKKRWGLVRFYFESHHEMKDEWLVHYLKCCELHALGQNVDDYLLSILG